MTRDKLIVAAGLPDAMLDENVWVYWHFTAHGVSETETLDTLLVVFSGDRVKFFKFVAAEPIRAFLVRKQALSKSKPIAAK